MPVPDVQIRINGADLPGSAQNDLHSVIVQEDLDAPSMFSFSLYNWDPITLQMTWSDDKLFSPGNEVEIWLGYVDDLRKVMLAEITSLEPSFQADETPTLTVRGYDHRHRLLRGTKTRSFTKMKDSAIASQIASGAGLRAQVVDSKVTQDYVLQNNQTDLEFLQDRATRIGYEVFVQEKALFFRPYKNDAQPQNTLTLGDDIIEFQPRMTTVPQVVEFVVRGWDLKQKQAIVGKASPGQVNSLMDGRKSGPGLANIAFGKSSQTNVDQGPSTKADADQMAVGQFNEMALTHISGEVTCYGNAALRVGMVVKIEGAGNTFSGRYYVSTVTHSVSPDAGYRTSFSVRRNAA
ncbi:MAG TPA: hypothetical protein VLU73_08380 [Methylococcaceae bacterium]|nr:hypothetical protein [Methylococcaceae bacterium]